jgi:Domain of unknown function (DUF6984)
METKFRPLHVNELALLQKLLDHDFQGRDALRIQLSSVTGRQTDEHGCLELRTEETIEADTEIASPTEGRCEDIDGGVIVVMLHVRKGKLHLLEILKEDGSEILRTPRAEDLTVY